MTPRYPVKIHRIEQNGAVRFKAATSLEKAQQDLLKVQRQLQWSELDYNLTIGAAKRTLEQTAGNLRKDPRIYWYVATTLDGFLHRLEEAGYYLPNPHLTFARDLDMSASSLKKILLFYRRFPSPGDINPAVPWERYRNNKVTVADSSKSSP